MSKLWLTDPDTVLANAEVEYPPAGGTFDVKAALTAGGGIITPASEGLETALLALPKDTAGTRLLTAIPASYQAAVIETPGLIGYWPLDDAGPTIRDASGGGHPGTLTGGSTQQPSLLPSGDGAAIDFATSNGYVTVINGGAFDFPGTQVFTVEAWVRAKSMGTQRFMLGTRDGNGTSGWLFYINSTGSIRLARYPTGGIVDSGGTPLADLAAHHVVVVYTGTAARFYVDGALISTPGGFAGAMSASPQPLVIGRDADLSGGQLMDLLQHAAIYNRALTAGEVAQHYARALTT